MADELQGLTLDHLEVDEIWTFCGKKQARLTVEEKETRHDIGDVYLWTALDQKTKLIAAHVVGKRSGDNARRLMRMLWQRMQQMPNPHASDRHAYAGGKYTPLCQISTDGFPAYPEAVDQFFGPYAKYGQIIKEYRNAKLPYTPSEMIGTRRTGITAIDKHEERTICTSHVERHNLTIRTFMRRFTRLSTGFSKKLENLSAACSMFIAYYNWCWRTRHHDRSGKPGSLRPPAAMMAGVTDHLWKFDDLYDAVMTYEESEAA